jgi:hypothetical protein
MRPFATRRRLGADIFGVIATAAVAMCVALGCQETETAIVVEFQIVGDGGDRAETLEVLIQCDDGQEERKRLQFDLSLLGAGMEPSLAIETDRDDPCTIILAAQVFDDSNDLIAVADRSFSFEFGSVQTISLSLDTAGCEDLDGDDAVAGLGCPFDDTGLLRDCDEFDDGVHEGAEETCNSRDDNCNGAVDDLDATVLEEACSEPIPWKRGVGLCAFWEPQCINSRIICPELPPEDDCDLPMDTNCDNRLSCGGCTDDLLRAAPCNECEVARCEGDEVVCVPRDDLHPPPGTPCVEAPCGSWWCDPETGSMLCVPGEFSVEICDDPAGRDEDCDGLANEDDDECSAIVPNEIECVPIYLPGLVPGDEGPDTESCDVHEVYSLRDCTFFTAGGVMRNDTQLLVFIAVPDNVVVGMPEVEGCCGCDVQYNANVTGYGIPAFVVEESTLRFLIMSAEHLRIHVPINIQGEGGSSGYSVTLVVPIFEDSTMNACETFCEVPTL